MSLKITKSGLFSVVCAGQKSGAPAKRKAEVLEPDEAIQQKQTSKRKNTGNGSRGKAKKQKGIESQHVSETGKSRRTAPPRTRLGILLHDLETRRRTEASNRVGLDGDGPLKVVIDLDPEDKQTPPKRSFGEHARSALIPQVIGLDGKSTDARPSGEPVVSGAAGKGFTIGGEAVRRLAYNRMKQAKKAQVLLNKVTTIAAPEMHRWIQDSSPLVRSRKRVAHTRQQIRLQDHEQVGTRTSNPLVRFCLSSQNQE